MEVVLLVTATCRTESCPENGKPNVFERESDIEFVVYCGQCQHAIEDITTKEKE